MKRLMTVILLLGVFAFLPLPALASSQPYDSMVTGTGNPEQDITAVQDAVNKGGTVLLKGTFNFGQKGQVRISKDVKIHGEKDQQGMPVTIIRGGFMTFFSPPPRELPVQAAGPKIAIQDLHFDGAGFTPVLIGYSSAASITGNKITNVKPLLTPAPLFGRKDLYLQKAILISPRYGGAKEYLPGAVTGTIVVADNDIDLTCEEPEKTMAQGLMILETTDVDAQILRNRITNCAKNSIESLDNRPGQGGTGMTLIKGNKIITALKGPPVPTPSAPLGIVAGWFGNPSAVSDPAQRTKIVITDNRIEARGETSVGIIPLIDGAVITSNHIILKGSKARGITPLGSNSLIANNKIEGTGLCGIACIPFKDYKGSQNTLVENDFSLFKASMADVFFQSSGNMLIGKQGKVADKGEGNRIIR